MKINILELKLGKVERIPVKFECNVSEKEKNCERYKIVTPISLEGEIRKVEEVYILSGKFKVGILAVCDRCLNEFEYNLTSEISECYKEDIDDDEEYIKIENNEIDLDSVLYKNVIVNIPIRWTCSDDCPGISYSDANNDERAENPFNVLRNVKFN